MVRLDQVDALPGSGIEKLRFLFERWAGIAATDFGRSILTIDPRTLADESRKTHGKSHRLLLRRIEALIEAGIEDGSVRKCNPTVMTLSLVGLFNSPAQWFRPDGPLSLEQAAAEMAVLMERGLAAGEA